MNRIETINAIKKNIRRAARIAGISLRGNCSDIIGPYNGYSYEQYRYILVDTEDIITEYADAADAAIEISEGWESGNFLPVSGHTRVMCKWDTAADVVAELADAIESEIYAYADK